jgi:hypothetical protein
MAQVESSKSLPSSTLNLNRTASKWNEKLNAAAVNPINQYFLPSTMEYEKNQEETKPELLQTQRTPNFKLNGVLSQVLFNVCDPQDIEGWDLNLDFPINGSNSHVLQNLHPSHPGFILMKCSRRSRL